MGMSSARCLGQLDGSLTPAGRGWSQVQGDFRISRGADGSVSNWVPGLAGPLTNCSYEGLEPSYRAVSQFLVGPSLAALPPGASGPQLREAGAGSLATSR